MKDRELKDREVKIKREIKIYYCPIIVFIDDMEKFQKKMKKKNKLRSIKNTRFCWLINYIPEPIRKSVGGFKNKFVSLFNTKYI